MIAQIDVTSRKGGTVMNTQHHQENEIHEKAQAAVPVQHKQIVASEEEQLESTAASLHRWRQAILIILAVALPFIAGSMVRWPWPGAPDFLDSELSFYSVVIATSVSVFIGAALLRSPWALLIIPLAWLGGEFLASVVRPLMEGGWATLQAETHFWDEQRTIILMFIERLYIWTGFGTILGMWLKARQQP